MKSYVSETAIVFKDLPCGFRVSFSRQLTAEPLPWYRWDKYIHFMKYGNNRKQAWQFRVLWFFIGRIKNTSQPIATDTTTES